MSAQLSDSAAALVQARHAATGLPAFPGGLPETLNDAYAIQAEAIRLWDEPIIGWKVGRITGAAEQRLGKNRFIGPLFASTVSRAADGDLAPFPVIADGSAALESEIVAVLGQDIVQRRTVWRREEVRALLCGLHIAIEVAGCPVPDINNLGPLASIAAFGNNLALILGPAIPDWQNMDVDGIACRTTIDGEMVGEAEARQLPGGPLEAVTFALNQAAELGIGLPAGTWLSTGAITGVHPIDLGQQAQADFGRLGVLHCRAVAARPA